MRIEDDEIYILEVNPNPDLVDETAFIQCATASGRTYSQTLCEIAEMAIERRRKANRPPADPVKAALPSDTLLREYQQGQLAKQAPNSETGSAPAQMSTNPQALTPQATLLPQPRRRPRPTQVPRRLRRPGKPHPPPPAIQTAAPSQTEDPSQEEPPAKTVESPLPPFPPATVSKPTQPPMPRWSAPGPQKPREP